MMKENSYRELMNEIHTPAGLNDRVLFAARQRTVTEELRTKTTPRHLAPCKKRPALLRTAVCAACALALVLGSVTLRPAEDGAVNPDGTPVMVPAWSFGLTAYAADTGEHYAPGANGGLAFTAGEAGMADPKNGDYTGCLFQVTGEGIETVSLSIDRGGLYRYELHTGMTEEEIAAARKAMDEGTLMTTAISQRDDGVWYMPEMTVLGTSATEQFDPAVQYGFWVPPEEMVLDKTMDLREASWADIDRFDGASLTVRVQFEDGSEQSKSYQLSTGRLKVVYEDDGTHTILPQLAGDDEICVYGVYAADESESRWLEWPVQGANTVSLSAPYGKAPNGAVHDGIDIPAAEGTPVLAVADGTVLETGSDAERGNYLVLDHGDGLTTVYGQCRNVDAKQGDAVKAGEMVGAVGATGMATGPHLHFEVRQDEKAGNPVAYFDSATRATLRAE